MLSAGRSETLARAAAALDSGRSIVVTGEWGLGRTTFLDRLAGHVEPAPHQIAGSDSDAGIALAAAAPLIAATLGTAEALAVYTELPPLLSRTGARVLVDDAHLLDRATTVLLAQLTRAGVPLALAAPAYDDLPDALRDLLARRGVEHLPLPPLDSDALLGLAADRVGGQLSVGAGAHLLARADGNPGVAVALTTASKPEPGTEGVEVDWVRSTPVLRDRVTARLAPLSAPARELAEVLAAAGRLPVAACPEDPLADLGAHGLARTGEGAVELSSVLLGDVVLDLMSPSTLRARQVTAAERLAAAGDGWQPAHVLLRVRAGLAVDAEDARVAADRWLAAHQPAKAAEVLATGLVAAPWGDLLSGAAAAASGDHGAAEASLAAVAATPGDDPAAAARLGAELGLVYAVGLADPARAVAEVTRIADRLERRHRVALDSDLVKWHLMAGLPPPSVPGAGQAADEVGRLGALVIAAMISSLDGSAADTRDHVSAGLELAEATGGLPAYSADLLQLSLYLAMAFDADVAAAERFALARRDAAARSAHPSLGMWEYATAELGLHCGRLDWSSALVARAARHLAWRDFTGLAASAVALRAAVEARRGRTAMALRDVGQLGEAALADVKVELHVARVHAEVRRLEGDVAGAAGVLARAGRRAVAESHRHLGAVALDDAWMVDPRADLVDELENLASTSPLSALFGARGRAWHTDQPDRLVEAADRLTAAGFPGRGAHGLRLAERLYRRQGRTEDAHRATRAADVLLVDAEASAWPDTASAATLTARELEIARMAASRVRSREIAEHLGVSVRTVDNHLGRIFRKLGVAGRDQLPAALGLPESVS